MTAVIANLCATVHDHVALSALVLVDVVHATNGPGNVPAVAFVHGDVGGVIVPLMPLMLAIASCPAAVGVTLTVPDVLVAAPSLTPVVTRELDPDHSVARQRVPPPKAVVIVTCSAVPVAL
jgi:hypothetical protein